MRPQSPIRAFGEGLWRAGVGLKRNSSPRGQSRHGNGLLDALEKALAGEIRNLALDERRDQGGFAERKLAAIRNRNRTTLRNGANYSGLKVDQA